MHLTCIIILRYGEIWIFVVPYHMHTLQENVWEIWTRQELQCTLVRSMVLEGRRRETVKTLQHNKELACNLVLTEETVDEDTVLFIQCK